MGVSRSNALLEKIRRNINVINSRSEEFKRATYESGCRMEEWAEKVVTTEKRHHTIYVTALSELEGKKVLFYTYFHVLPYPFFNPPTDLVHSYALRLLFGFLLRLP